MAPHEVSLPTLSGCVRSVPALLTFLVCLLANLSRNYFDTKDSYKMTDLQIRLRYRQRFLRDWLSLEIAPQVTFPETYNREANPGLIVKMEADIGNLSEK